MNSRTVAHLLRLLPKLVPVMSNDISLSADFLPSVAVRNENQPAIDLFVLHGMIKLGV
jgi:hypothetical protein